MFSSNIQNNSFDYSLNNQSNAKLISETDDNIRGDIYFVDKAHHIMVDTMLSDTCEDDIIDIDLINTNFDESIYTDTFYDTDTDPIDIAVLDDPALLEADTFSLDYINNIDNTVGFGGYHNNDWIYYWTTEKVKSD